MSTKKAIGISFVAIFILIIAQIIAQVIRNVNERKTVQTNMISFVSHGAGILTIMEASAEHDC